ncbi:MAG: UPF0164 family protein [Treponema sp.]|nr:UPF0164 family protein [Treponema sp.]
MKKIFFSAVFLNILNFAWSLDLTEVASGLEDFFSTSIDSNEGSTSFRSLNIPSGGRIESLGTAFVAMNDDSSFFDYNPAVSSTLPDTEIAVHHNAWISDSAMETLTFTQRSGKLGYGAQIKCFYVPFSEYNLYGDRVTGSYYSETSATFNFSYNFMAGYLFKGLSWGANAKLAWRSIPDYTDNRDDSIISGSGLAQSALGIMADTGLFMEFNTLKFYQDREANLKVGLALNNFGISLTGFGQDIKKDDDTPARISAGFSYRPFKRLLITSEIRKPLLLSDLTASTNLSWGSGIEIMISRIFKFQTGLLLQGANPRLSFGSEFEIKGIKMDISYTLDLTSSVNPVNHISLSAKIPLGDRGRKASLAVVDRLYLEGLKFYSAGDYNEAIRKWDKAIKTAQEAPLSIKYEPAIQARDAALHFNMNKADLENMYKVSVEE